MVKKIQLLLCFLTIFKTHTIVIVTIPKSGTHLLEKALIGITGYKKVKKEDDPLLFKVPLASLQRYLSDISPSDFFSSHLNYTPEYEELLRTYNQKIVMIIRDPRDQVVSNTYWMHSLPDVYTQWKGQTFEEILVYNIKSVVAFSNLWLPWVYAADTSVLTFEDLVGERGGGTAHRQRKAVKFLAEQLGCNLSIMQLCTIADTLFGATETFRSGQIGSWKKHFTKEHKELFKLHAGKLLIDLEYESDLEWD